MFHAIQLFSIRRRSKFYRMLRLAIRQIFYALKAYNKFSSIIASDTRRTKANVISICKAITNRNQNDNNNRSVSQSLYFHIILLLKTLRILFLHSFIYLFIINLLRCESSQITAAKQVLTRHNLCYYYEILSKPIDIKTIELITYIVEWRSSMNAHPKYSLIFSKNIIIKYIYI
jgi:hypothetical protein